MAPRPWLPFKFCRCSSLNLSPMHNIRIEVLLCWWKELIYFRKSHRNYYDGYYETIRKSQILGIKVDSGTTHLLTIGVIFEVANSLFTWKFILVLFISIGRRGSPPPSPPCQHSESRSSAQKVRWRRDENKPLLSNLKASRNRFEYVGRFRYHRFR